MTDLDRFAGYPPRRWAVFEDEDHTVRAVTDEDGDDISWPEMDEHDVAAMVAEHNAVVAQRDAAVRERDELRDRLREAARIIETADQRAMATDGPVGHARDNMHDNEWRRLYLLVSDPRAALHGEAEA